MSSREAPRVILITGANKGLGYEVVKQLISNPSESQKHLILLGSRDIQRGEDALKKLGSPSNVHLLQLDTSSLQSIQQAKKQVQEKYGGYLDILINNAGIAMPVMSNEAGRKISDTNYYGPKWMTEQFADLIRENGRIINVASEVGAWTLNEMSKDRQAKYEADDLTKDQLDHLVEEFISSIDSKQFEQLGYNPRSPYLIYGVSKIALIILTSLEARKWHGAKNVLILSVCPGYCATDLNNHGPGARSAELGAHSILHTVNTAADQLENGAFYQDGQKKPKKFPCTMNISSLIEHVNEGK